MTVIDSLYYLYNYFAILIQTNLKKETQRCGCFIGIIQHEHEPSANNLMYGHIPLNAAMRIDKLYAELCQKSLIIP